MRASGMEIADWWPLLTDEQRASMMEHNGEALPAELVAAIANAGGSVASDASWIGESDPTGFYLSSRAVDWIEAVANGEDPDS